MSNFNTPLADVKWPSINSVQYKANQVIESCLNQDHIKGARKYVNQVFKIYSSSANTRYSHHFTIDPHIYEIYRELMDKLEIKESNLSLIEDSGKV